MTGRRLLGWEAFRTFIAERLGFEVAEFEQPLAEIDGLDSIVRFEMLIVIEEELDVSLHEDALFLAENLRDVYCDYAAAVADNIVQ